MNDDQLPFSPAADRNKQPILETLRSALPPNGLALEVASGTGQHVAWFAAGMPEWHWQPSDATGEGFAAIAARAAGLANVRAPLLLDVLAWPALPERYDAVYCANMLHIAPWATCAALMRGSAQCLAPGGVLITYGPYLERGVATSPGNLEFDASLRARDPSWGIRQLDDVATEAQRAGLRLQLRHAMPANNLLLVWGLAAGTTQAAPSGLPR